MAQTDQNLNAFYESLSLNRNKRQMTKTDFVKKMVIACDCSLSSMRDWCTGRNLTREPRFLEPLSKETGIPVENLFKRF